MEIVCGRETTRQNLEKTESFRSKIAQITISEIYL